MLLLLGIDTGGTFTDAVILDDDTAGVIASAKALTTHDDLSIGIAQAIRAVLVESGISGDRIALVSVSTTLATNALVEGRGRDVALVFAGFAPADAARAGLQQALDGDPLILIGGGHDSSGSEIEPPDLPALENQIGALPAQPSAFAVVSRFASRNTTHETIIRDCIRTRTGRPVTCGHELSARLNGPLRAVTAVLNARLIGLISALVAAVEGTMHTLSITAPLMVVRGDGALVSAAFARTRPIETILSGPAASLVGASALTGIQDAVIADIGGTTTDIGLLTAGRPRLNPEGAEVGGHRTMVEAVDMRAVGLGGDSEVALDTSGLRPVIRLGPRRAVPVSLLATDHEALVCDALARVLEADRPGPSDVSFALPVPGVDPANDGEARVLSKLSNGPCPIAALQSDRKAGTALRRLVQSGRIRISAFTPSDAAHVLGLHKGWNTQAAALAAQVLARCRDGRGAAVATDGKALAQTVIDRLTEASANAILGTAMAGDGIGLAYPGTDPLVSASRLRTTRAVRLDIGLALPLVGLGAPAASYYGKVADLLGTRAELPPLGGVANAVGAVSGQVRISAKVTLTQTPEQTFRIHHADARGDIGDLDKALSLAGEIVSREARSAALAAGAADPAVTVTTESQRAVVEGRETLVEAVITATATGRPRFKGFEPARASHMSGQDQPE